MNINLREITHPYFRWLRERYRPAQQVSEAEHAIRRKGGRPTTQQKYLMWLFGECDLGTVPRRTAWLEAHDLPTNVEWLTSMERAEIIAELRECKAELKGAKVKNE